MTANATKFKKTRLRELFSIDKIITILHQHFTPDFIFPGEKHDFWEFIYVEKGEIIISAENSEYLLKAGELAFHKPDEFHTVRATGDLLSSAIVISFESKSQSMQFFEKKILLLDENEKEILFQILKESATAFLRISRNPPDTGMRRKKSVPPGTEQIIKVNLELLLLHIYRRRDTIQRKDRYTISPNQAYDEKLAKDIQAFLESNYFKDIRLDELSRQVGVSVSKAKKVFKSYSGGSIIEYLIDIRIKHAKAMIDKGDLNFSQISEMTGFKTIHYFSRVFKKKTKMTPSAYKTLKT